MYCSIIVYAQEVDILRQMINKIITAYVYGHVFSYIVIHVYIQKPARGEVKI